MNILLVHDYYISRIPPVRNLIQTLVQNGHCVTVIARKDVCDLHIEQNSNLKFIFLPEDKLYGFSYFQRNAYVKKYVREEMKKNDILWTTLDSAVRALGRDVFNYRHIMQLMELIEDIPLVPKQNFINCNLKRYARKAYKIVVPEYNRAHIQKVWWELDKLPIVLPNKMNEVQLEHIPEHVQNIIREMKEEHRKIILYQGVLGNDRDLETFAKAIDKLSNKYCFYLMGRDNSYRDYLCRNYFNIKYIPYIEPPYHLAVTQNADIGILPYKAAKVKHFSVLNALYCAPNKIFEYAAYGVPMIGTDVPGLYMPFKTNDIGVICKDQTVDAVEDAIKEIENRYDTLRENCFKYYDSIDLDAIVKEILE